MTDVKRLPGPRTIWSAAAMAASASGVAVVSGGPVEPFETSPCSGDGELAAHLAAPTRLR